MAVKPEGAPCWVDAMFPDLEAAKTFYGELLGWTFGEPDAEFGYTQAYAGGANVAGVGPQMPGWSGPQAWTLYFASADAGATADKIREQGGELLTDVMPVGDYGTMLLAKDPGGVVFGIWQAGTHEGFGKEGEPGSYAWAEITTRDAGKADAFFPAVFGYEVRTLEDDAIDFKLYNLGGDTVAGRLKMTPDFPPEMPPYVSVLRRRELRRRDRYRHPARRPGPLRAARQPVRPLRSRLRPAGHGLRGDRPPDDEGGDAQGELTRAWWELAANALLHGAHPGGAFSSARLGVDPAAHSASPYPDRFGSTSGTPVRGCGRTSTGWR